MSKETWINVGVGIVAGVAAFFTFGASYALLAFSLGATAAAMIQGPSQQKSGALRPDELQVNQSAENATIPVIFGTTRVPANYIYVGADKLKTEPLYSEQEGGKGGGSQRQQTGFRYKFPISYGICMGEIDALLKVIGSPGMDTMAKFPGGLEFTDGNPEWITIELTKTSGETEYVEGGEARFYPGSSNQGSNSETEDVNHRHVCWVDFPKYVIDGTPSPRSMLFQVRRMPIVKDTNGDPIDGFETRGSTNEDHEEYHDANPAAVAWEVLTNRHWGKGMDPDLLDAESFAMASQFYAAKRIGISTAMGAQTVTAFMNRLRDIFGLWVWQDGELIKARCLYDRNKAYDYRPKIDPEDVIGEPTFQRPSVSGTINEIRLEFTNRKNNWQTEVATAMDLAHAETIGGIRSQAVDGAEIGTRRAAELLAHAMLRQMAYPSASLQLRLRRTYAGMQPGTFVRFDWDQWREGSIAKTFWRVVEITDDDQGTEGITVTLVEDIYATARYSDDDTWEEPEGTLDDDDPLNDDDLTFGDLTADQEPGLLTPISHWEPNSFITQGTRRLAIMPTRRSGFVQGWNQAFSRLGYTTTTAMPFSSLVPLNGTILDAIAIDSPKLSRDAAYQFRIQLEVEADAENLEAATGLVIDSTDHFDALTADNVAILRIGNELFRIGHAEVTAAGVVTVRTFMRSEFATEKEAHDIGATCNFFPTINPTTIPSIAAMPTNQATAVNFHLTPSMIGGDASETTDYPADLSGIVLAGESTAPQAPEPIGATRVGDVWTIEIRPKMWDGGAGVSGFLEDDAYTNLMTDLSALSLRFQKQGGTDVVTVPAGADFGSPPFTMPSEISIDSLEWTPDDGAVGSGKLTIQLTFDASPAILKIWSVRNGKRSVNPLDVPQP